MQLTERRSEGLLRVYDVVAPASELEQQLAAKIQEVQPRMRINGFRPGKVPVSHIRKMYGASMMQDIINETVQNSTKQALDKAKVRPASEPKLELKSDINQVAEGKADLAFELSLEIMPEFEPADLKTISITKPVAPVEDSEVDEELKKVAEVNRSYEDKDGPAADGDALTIDFVGRIDGEVFEGGSAEDAPVVIGSKRFIPGFEEQLIGAKAGDDRTLNVTFPDDYGATELRGKAAQFDVKVKTVKGEKTATLDDAWAKELGMEDLATLREALRKRIESDHNTQSRAKAKRILFDELDKTHSFDLPPRMVEAEFNQIWRQIEADKAEGKLDPADAEKSDDQLRSEYQRIAERRVRLGLLLAEIGRRNNIEVTDQEAMQEVVRMLRGYPPQQQQQIYDAYAKNPNLLAQVRAPIYEEKVVDYVLELVKVSNQTVSREELYKDDDAEIPAAAEAPKAKKKKAKAEDGE